jgi:hypothetical protein
VLAAGAVDSTTPIVGRIRAAPASSSS